MQLRVNGELELAIVDEQASSRKNPRPAPVLNERKVRTVWWPRAEFKARTGAGAKRAKIRTVWWPRAELFAADGTAAPPHASLKGEVTYLIHSILKAF
jgi:hypothetical protein